MANQEFTLIVPAAGRGERMQSKTPKPYLKLGACTVLEHTLSRFVGIPGLRQVIVSTSDEYRNQTKELLHKLFPKTDTRVVQGGAERQNSIYNALREVDANAALVAVHDAVRPFVSNASILECLRQASECGGAVVGVPAKDTIKRVDGLRKIIGTPSRSELWQAQTPQIFRRSILMKAFEHAITANKTGTDDASLVEDAGEDVIMVEGSRDNFKLTYPLDFKIAEILILESKTD